jgi:F-type H+-transporting ATPase subunit gamma
MRSLRDIRRKIGAVKNIQKITRAMKFVAAAKLRKVQDRVAASRPYAEKMRDLIGYIAPQVPAELITEMPLLQVREGQRVGVVVLTSDRGLCGSYNNNVIREAAAFIGGLPEGTEVELLTIGRKGTDYFRKRDHPVRESFAALDENSPFSEVQVVTQTITGLYTHAENPVDRVHIAYTQFVSPSVHRPQVIKFLPIEPPSQAGSLTGLGSQPEGESRLRAQVEYLLEPGPRELLQTLLPRFVDNQIYQYLLEAIASEHGARMIAMTNATDNAAEMMDTLTLDYNKARQESITKELLDVVGGAEAVR